MPSSLPEYTKAILKHLNTREGLLRYAVQMFKDIEWMGVAEGVEGLCLFCWNSDTQGHKEDCELAEFIRVAEESYRVSR